MLHFSPRFVGTDKPTCKQHVMTMHLRRKEKKRKKSTLNSVGETSFYTSFFISMGCYNENYAHTHIYIYA